MMRVACAAFLLLLSPIASPLREKDFTCPHADSYEPAISPTSVCDGTVECSVPAGADADGGLHDENPEICEF
ncbi:hypothetical protein V5799_025301 [Amblyomma americanum]|uniref:Secreted protein n=1 Tax=Amblyomma americanum TaxID=6943 RepID=A0AAQ4E9N8_AMBAM